ncbi:MAG: hypothetical protein KBG84_06120 [Planctomycetes bacterium]|nr:hypothetical protein [Planctomycetota bacterium]
MLLSFRVAYRSMSLQKPPSNEPPHEPGHVFEEEDEDLDLSLDDVQEGGGPKTPGAHQLSLAERMREAALRGRTKGVNADGTQEVVEEVDEDLGDLNLDGEPGHEVVEEDDAELDDLDLGDVAETAAAPAEAGVSDGVSEIEGGWDDTEAIERAKVEQMGLSLSGQSPASVVEMKLDEAGVAPAPEMQAGPMTMALYEPGSNLAGEAPVEESEEGAQIGTGENASQHVENRPHELIDSGDSQNSALPELESGAGEPEVQSFNAGVLPVVGETITYRRDETGQVVRGDSGRLKAVPDKTLTFERDETGQIVRGDHLLRRLAQEEDPALRELAEKKRAEEDARAAQQEADAQRLLEEKKAQEAEAALRLEQQEAQQREQQEEERQLAEQARQAAQRRAEEQKRKQQEVLRAREEQELARQAAEAARQRKESERQKQADVRRRAEEQEVKRRDEQDARQTYDDEQRRRSAARDEVTVAEAHGSDFERDMEERRQKHEARRKPVEQRACAMQDEIARLEREQKVRREREAKTQQAWTQHAARGQGQQNQRVDGGGVEAVSKGHSGHTRDAKQEDSLVADDSGAPLGRGLDVGTANLVASRMDAEGGIEFFPARNAFLDVPEDPYTLKMLKSQGVPYIKRENKLYVIGQDAFELANIFNREMRRPMKNGLISPTDADAMPMEVELFKKILGPPRVDGEACYYSIPADPVDSTMNIVYHTNIANGLLQRLGYKGTPFNEGLAIVFSELGDDEFTGIGISCGGGMVNVCVAFRSMNVISFSSAKGGDWIDQQAAQVMGCAASRITHIKESGVDINAPKSPEEEAIVIYYRHLIKYSLENIVKKFAITKDIPNFPKPVPIAVSGGTSMVGGFIEVFKDEFSKISKNFPIKVSDVRRAEDQFNATSKGCLLAALSNEE